jgi:hypothetical protein
MRLEFGLKNPAGFFPWSEGEILSENSAKQAAVQGTLRERPFPRLLQQLYRKKFTGYFVIADQTGDESEVYLRDGSPVHVCRPVDTDRLGNLLVEYGVVPAEIVAAASAEVTEGTRMGDVLERMGVLNKQTLAQVLKSQVVRKLTRLFFIAEGTYAVYAAPHNFGEGADLALMRVDPRAVIYAGIRAAYDLQRVTQELTRLIGLRFRLLARSSAFIAAMGVPPEDAIVDSLRRGWMTLDDLDSVTSRPLEVRSVVLALYYADLLEREHIAETARVSGSAIPRAVHFSDSSEMGAVLKPAGNPGPALLMTPEAGSPPAPPRIEVAPAPGASHPPNERPLAPAASPRPSSTVASVRVPPVVAPVPAVVVPMTPLEDPAARPGMPSVTASTGAPTRGQPASPAPGPSSPAVRAPMVNAMRFDAKPPQAPPAKVTGAALPVQISSPEALRASIQDMAQKLGKATYFELLGVGQNVSSDEVSTAFVRAARQFHPDRLVSSGLQDLQPLAEKILARINEAAMVLGDASRRAEYVASLAAGPQAASTSLPALFEAEKMFLKGEVFLKKGEHAKAVELFTGACQKNPGEPQYRAFLAWARFDDPSVRKEALVRETLKTVEDVVRERPKFARGFYWVGLLWKFLNETDKAERAFREAVSLDASFIDAGRELRLIEMRKSKSSSGKPGVKPEPPRGGGLMGKLFKK